MTSDKHLGDMCGKFGSLVPRSSRGDPDSYCGACRVPIRLAGSGFVPPDPDTSYGAPLPLAGPCFVTLCKQYPKAPKYHNEGPFGVGVGANRPLWVFGTSFKSPWIHQYRANLPTLYIRKYIKSHPWSCPWFVSNYSSGVDTQIQMGPPCSVWSSIGKYQAEVHHLSHAQILLIMGLFEVLIVNMMFICGANNIKINIT